jgi:hypothetical protein
MKKIKTVVIALVCLLLVLALPTIAQAGPRTNTKVAIDEIVNLGVMVHGKLTYEAVAGRMVSQTAAYRAQSGVAEMSMVFPAPGTGRSIATARLYILSNSGYSGTVTLTMITFNLDGTSMHKVLSGSVDLLSLPTGSWVALSLSEDPNELMIDPGEFLAAQVTLDPVPTIDGEFDARVMFEILTY